MLGTVTKTPREINKRLVSHCSPRLAQSPFIPTSASLQCWQEFWEGQNIPARAEFALECCISPRPLLPLWASLHLAPHKAEFLGWILPWQHRAQGQGSLVNWLFIVIRYWLSVVPAGRRLPAGCTTSSVPFLWVFLISSMFSLMNFNVLALTDICIVILSAFP